MRSPVFKLMLPLMLQSAIAGANELSKPFASVDSVFGIGAR